MKIVIKFRKEVTNFDLQNSSNKYEKITFQLQMVFNNYKNPSNNSTI